MNKALIMAVMCALAQAQRDSGPTSSVGGLDGINYIVKEGPYPDGSYYFKYETPEGVLREEVGTAEGGNGFTVIGTYGYVGPDGQTVIMDYISDSLGYRTLRRQPGGKESVSFAKLGVTDKVKFLSSWSRLPVGPDGSKYTAYFAGLEGSGNAHTGVTHQTSNDRQVLGSGSVTPSHQPLDHLEGEQIGQTGFGLFNGHNYLNGHAHVGLAHAINSAGLQSAGNGAAVVFGEAGGNRHPQSVSRLTNNGNTGFVAAKRPITQFPGNTGLNLQTGASQLNQRLPLNDHTHGTALSSSNAGEHTRKFNVHSSLTKNRQKPSVLSSLQEVVKTAPSVFGIEYNKQSVPVNGNYNSFVISPGNSQSNTLKSQVSGSRGAASGAANTFTSSSSHESSGRPDLFQFDQTDVRPSTFGILQQNSENSAVLAGLQNAETLKRQTNRDEASFLSSLHHNVNRPVLQMRPQFDSTRNAIGVTSHSAQDQRVAAAPFNGNELFTVSQAIPTNSDIRLQSSPWHSSLQNQRHQTTIPDVNNNVFLKTVEPDSLTPSSFQGHHQQSSFNSESSQLRGSSSSHQFSGLNPPPRTQSHESQSFLSEAQKLQQSSSIVSSVAQSSRFSGNRIQMSS